MRRRLARHTGTVLFLSPALILIGLFIVVPILWAFWLSLTNASLLGPTASRPAFVGLENYARLATDPDFYAAAGRSIVFIFASAVVGQFLLGLGSALALSRRSRAAGWLASAILLPLVVPETVASLSWASMLAPAQFGTLNRALAILALPPVDWLQSHPMESIIMVNIWRGIAFAMIFFQAALQTIPSEILEAAAVDGASPWQQLISIKLPIIRQAITLYMLLTTITTLGVFGLIYFLTRGGPGGATTVLSIYLYERAFRYFDIGFGSAAAALVLVVATLLSVLYLRVLRPQL
jgi:multiple sugar transport system permease protein